MINKNIYQLKKYCTEYQKIENYEEALKSPLRYDLHHRREISEMQSRSYLIFLHLYYHRPPEELIFLEHGDHQRLHKANLSDETKQRMSEAQKGKNLSVETKQKISDAKKGKPGPWLGKPLSVETRQKISDANKGKPGTCLGKHWHLENGKHVYTD